MDALAELVTGATPRWRQAAARPPHLPAARCLSHHADPPWYGAFSFRHARSRVPKLSPTRLLLQAMEPKSLRKALDQLDVTAVDKRKTGEMQVALAKEQRADPALLTGIMYKAELVKACVEMANLMGSKKQKHGGSRSLPLSATLHSTSQYGQSAPLSSQAMRGDSRSCRRMIVISAFYTNKMLRQLANGQTVQILVNGLGEQRLRTQVADLAKLQRDLRKGGRQAEVRLAFSPGTFHPKVYLFEAEDNSWVAWIGSANATSAALGKSATNEEVMLRLDPAPDFVVDYAEQAWASAQQIEHCEPPVDSLSALFQTGVLYYRPYIYLPLTVNPFRQLLYYLERDEHKKLHAFNHPTADDPEGIGAFNIKRVYGRQEVAEGQIKKPQIRRFAIETCYGLWVSSLDIESVESKLYEVEKEKDAYYKGLRDWLKGTGRTTVLDAFAAYLAAVHGTMEENDVDWQSALKRGNIASPFGDLTPIEDLIEVVVASLSDKTRRQRLCRPYIGAAMPNFNEDAEAANEFERTFFESLEEQSFREKGKSRAARNFFDAGIPERATAKRIQLSLEERLNEQKWYKELFLGNEFPTTGVKSQQPR